MLPEKVTNIIGKTGETMIMQVEKGAIKRYADAVGDFNPLHWDDDYAMNSGYGSIIAPYGFFGWPARWTGDMPLADNLSHEMLDTLAQEGYSRLIAGGMEDEFFRPVRAGDILIATPKVISINERDAKSGKMYLCTVEVTYINQNGDLVAKERRTTIAR